VTEIPASPPADKPEPPEALSASEAAALHHEDERLTRTHTRAHAQGASSESRVMSRHAPLPPCSEIALAERFVDRHQDELRHVAEWRGWMVYDGARWQRERTALAFEWARRVAREAATEISEPGIAARVATARTRAAIVALASADRRIAATADQWDCDPWQLNTPAGVVDLRTGDMRPGRPDDYLTRVTAVAPDSECPCPRWLAFLARTFERDGRPDVALIAYMQRVLGYALTGVTAEHAMWFLYGTGANGKSVLTSTVAGIMGDYHRTSAIETFTASPSDRHPTELASLRGARLVTAVETEEGRRWAEARIKTLTGGDTIAARFMRQDFFEFRPVFKLVIAGNHKPGLRSVDEAIRRRFNLVPFGTTIPKDERDPELAERLRDEWPGILAWLIQGCLWWQETGLDTPEVVAGATDAYLAAEDALGAWLEECCAVGPRHSDSAAALFASWKGWAERAGEKPGSRARFGKTLDARGFSPVRTMAERRYEGLMVRSGHPGMTHDAT
jgi:putative DNA primase/helicase